MSNILYMCIGVSLETDNVVTINEDFYLHVFLLLFYLQTTVERLIYFNV